MVSVEESEKFGALLDELEMLVKSVDNVITKHKIQVIINKFDEMIV